jgi:hypothetical protein
MDLDAAFETIAPPQADAGVQLYAVVSIPGLTSYLVGKDDASRACLLVATAQGARDLHPAIRLETIDVQFDLHCRLKKGTDPASEGVFTVIRCRALDGETIRYFLSVCQTVMKMLGDSPSRSQVAAAVNRLIAIFRRAQNPPSRTLNGLFGELYIISRSRDPAKAVAAWRIDDTARFDFTAGDVRLDVKSSGGRLRMHTFSFEQCNPPPATFGVVASLFAERIARGVSLHSLVERIEGRLAGNADLILKLREVVASTLGSALRDAFDSGFDMRLAESSLRFFRTTDIPAIRGNVPAGVSDVHFTSDLSALQASSAESLAAFGPDIRDLLPSDA